MPSERIQRQIDTLLDEVDDAMRQLDWQTVTQRARAVLAFDSENEDALAYLAAAEKASGAGRLVVLLTSDHGEALGEEDYWFVHGNVTWPTVSRIPFRSSKIRGVVWQG